MDCIVGGYSEALVRRYFNMWIVEGVWAGLLSDRGVPQTRCLFTFGAFYAKHDKYPISTLTLRVDSGIRNGLVSNGN